MNHHLHFTSFDLFNILIEKRLANFTDCFKDSINYMFEQYNVDEFEIYNDKHQN